ncbi:MAG: hypothetical protein KDC10_05095 [Calditrichaeota bacterium]|nr:hypothetical protein [Candidatus Cloacimonadota bacterium]MCB1046559.1 hypothetical protein [Calditrichota bacterium]MCB9474779.1 hypothetical protein [Candidatus Delongbacteria bacterium]
MRPRSWLWCLYLLLGLLPARATSLAELSVDPLPDTLHVGDPFVLSLHARVGEGVSLRWITPEAESLKPLHLLEELPADTLGPGEYRKSWRAAIFKAGEQTIAPFEVGVDPGDGEFLLPSDSLRVSVLSVLNVALSRGDSLAPRDILDPAPVPLSWREILPWLLGALLVGLLGLLGWRWLKRRPQDQPRVEAPAPPVDPWKRWLERLDALRREQRWSRGETIEYYADLSLALRGLLEDSTGRPFREMTHDEVRDALADGPLEGPLFQTLMGLLLESDMVKYARQWPSDERNRQALDDAAAWASDARAQLIRPQLVQVAPGPEEEGR